MRKRLVPTCKNEVAKRLAEERRGEGGQRAQKARGGAKGGEKGGGNNQSGIQNLHVLRGQSRLKGLKKQVTRNAGTCTMRKRPGGASASSKDRKSHT